MYRGKIALKDPEAKASQDGEHTSSMMFKQQQLTNFIIILVFR